LVFEIFDLKVADKPTNRQTFTSTDNKGPLKLSAREPIHKTHTLKPNWNTLKPFATQYYPHD